jgi:hypothetical protein
MTANLTIILGISLSIGAIFDCGQVDAIETPTLTHFVEVSHRAGLDAFRNVSGGPAKDYILESVGGGVAVLDYDGDGLLDIFLVSGSTLKELGGPQGSGPHRNKLFRNNGNGTFTDVTEAAGLGHSGWCMGAAVADFDNDGKPDIYLTCVGQNVLYHNNGDRTFSDVTGKAGVVGGSWSTGAAWGDYDRDGYLDLYVARYVDFSVSEVPAKGGAKFCQYKGYPVECGPRGLRGLTGILYHNNGDGTFTDVTKKALGPDVPAYYSFTPLWLDIDGDGWPDLFVANDGTPNLLYHNRGDGTFEEMGAMSGAAYNKNGLEQAGMGADFADYLHDSRMSIFVTNFSDDYNTLHRNLGGGNFSDATEEAKLFHVSWNELSWGTQFLDFDMDTWPDLFVVNGHVYPEVDQYHMDSTYKENPQLLRNRGDGTFEEVTAAAGPDLLQKRSGRGLAVGDIDNDGDLDLVINNLDDTPSLFRCDSAPGAQWISIHLEGTKSNRDGIGAEVRLRAGGVLQVKQVHQSGGFLSSNDLRCHFGLGRADNVEELEIRWPSGLVQKFQGIRSKQFIRIKEGESSWRLEPTRKVTL